MTGRGREADWGAAAGPSSGRGTAGTRASWAPASGAKGSRTSPTPAPVPPSFPSSSLGSLCPCHGSSFGCPRWVLVLFGGERGGYVIAESCIAVSAASDYYSWSAQPCDFRQNFYICQRTEESPTRNSSP